MITWSVPLEVYPDTYNGQPLCYAALASQKNHMALYLMCLYGSPEQEAWFRQAWAKTGKKLDMGKCCVRFKKLEDVPLEVVGEAIRRMPAKKLTIWPMMPAACCHDTALIGSLAAAAAACLVNSVGLSFHTCRACGERTKR